MNNELWEEFIGKLPSDCQWDDDCKNKALYPYGLCLMHSLFFPYISLWQVFMMIIHIKRDDHA